jgi:hypothetical protein
MANAFNTYFTSIGNNLANDIPQSSETYIDAPSTHNQVFSFPTVTAEFVQKQLSGISAHKAVGLDAIPGRLLKIAAPEISSSLLH